MSWQLTYMCCYFFGSPLLFSSPLALGESQASLRSLLPKTWNSVPLAFFFSKSNRKLVVANGCFEKTQKLVGYLQSHKHGQNCRAQPTPTYSNHYVGGGLWALKNDCSSNYIIWLVDIRYDELILWINCKSALVDFDTEMHVLVLMQFVTRLVITCYHGRIWLKVPSKRMQVGKLYGRFGNSSGQKTRCRWKKSAQTRTDEIPLTKQARSFFLPPPPPPPKQTNDFWAEELDMTWLTWDSC